MLKRGQTCCMPAEVPWSFQNAHVTLSNDSFPCRGHQPVLVPNVSNSEEHQVQVWDDHTKRAQHLQILGSYQAHKTLGLHKDPAGTQAEQFCHI